jgi:hypothetical protein
MAFNGKIEILRRHSAPIVDDTDEPPASRFYCDVDAGRAGVKRILDELLDGGGRPLHHLARRDAIDKNRIKTADGHGSHHLKPIKMEGLNCPGLE